MVRKYIDFTEEQYKIIGRYIKSKEISLSEFLINSALNEIKREENFDLLDYLRTNAPFVTEQEQNDYVDLDFKEIDRSDFIELSLDDIL